MRPTGLGVALAVVVVLAGCSVPTADRAAPGVTSTGTEVPPTTQATPTTEPASIDVRNGSVEADPGAVFARVQRLVGTNVSPPSRVRVVHDPERLAPGVRQRVPRYWRLLGVEPEQALTAAERDRLENGVTTGMGAVRLYPGDATAREVELLLAHEFVHYVQFVRGDDATLRRGLDRTTESWFIERAVLEGVAVATTDAYVDDHLGGEPSAARYDRLHDQVPEGSPARYANLAYIAGADYVAARFDDPAAASALYADPPSTSEQLLHRTEEPPTPLPVTVQTGGWRHVGTDRMGEAFLRVALENGLPPERAASTAAGWGNDSLAVFRPVGGGEASYVWVVRFDDAAAATAGEEALRDWLSARGNRTEGGWRVAGVRASLSRPDDRTVAVAFGSPAFVEGVTVVAESGGSVGVRVGEQGNVAESFRRSFPRSSRVSHGTGTGAVARYVRHPLLGR